MSAEDKAKNTAEQANGSLKQAAGKVPCRCTRPGR